MKAAAVMTTLAFFTKPFGAYVHVQEAVVSEDDFMVTVRYRFVPHETDEATSEFALINLGSLPPGLYSVKVAGELDPAWAGTMPADYVQKWEPQVVCGPTSFEVGE